MFEAAGPNLSCQAISPQWAILPGVKAIALNAHHFGMTKINEPQGREIIELPRRVSQEALKRRWIESSQKYHGEDRSQASVTTPILKRDKIFSLAPKEENRESAEEGEPTTPTVEGDTDTERDLDRSSFRWKMAVETVRESYDTLVERLHEEGTNNNIKRLERLLGEIRPSDDLGFSRRSRQEFETLLSEIPLLTLDLAVQDHRGLEILQALFVLRGDQIKITERQLNHAAENRHVVGTDILELILLLRGDEVSEANVGDIAKAAAANGGNGAAVMRCLLDRYGDRHLLTKGVAEAAQKNNSDMRLEVSRILLKAAMNKRELAFARLLGEPRSPRDRLEDRFSWKMLSWAAAQKDDETFELLLDSGQVADDVEDFNRDQKRNLDKGDWTTLLYAIYKNDVAVIKALVRTRRITKDDLKKKRIDTPALEYAEAQGLHEAVEQLRGIVGDRIHQTDS